MCSCGRPVDWEEDRAKSLKGPGERNLVDSEGRGQEPVWKSNPAPHYHVQSSVIAYAVLSRHPRHGGGVVLSTGSATAQNASQRVAVSAGTERVHQRVDHGSDGVEVERRIRL